MFRRSAALSAAHVRQSLLQFDGQVPEISPRMQRRDAQGVLLPRPSGPPAGRAATPAAVLALLYPNPDQQGLTILFTRRTGHLRKHANQISFPGGRVEADDPSYLAAARRETHEELGVETQDFELWAELKPVYVPPTNYLIYPFVMFAGARPKLSPNPGEVAELLEIPLSALVHPDSFTTYAREYQGQSVWEPCFRYQSNIIWGATAWILEQLLIRIQAGLEPSHRMR